jgi:hypothetical protein
MMSSTSQLLTIVNSLSQCGSVRLGAAPGGSQQLTSSGKTLELTAAHACQQLTAAISG